MSLILCLPFLRLKTSAATLMPSLMPVPTRASDPLSGTSTPTTNSSAAAARTARPATSASPRRASAVNFESAVVAWLSSCFSGLLSVIRGSRSAAVRARRRRTLLRDRLQLVLENLAVRRGRQRRQDDDFARPLVRREPRCGESGEIGGCHGRPGGQFDERDDFLVAGDGAADDRRLRDVGMRVQHGFDLDRIHVESRADDQFLRAADDEQRAVRFLRARDRRC